MHDYGGNFLYEVKNSTDTVPNIDALHARGISIDSHPAGRSKITYSGFSLLRLKIVHIVCLF